MEFRSIKEDGQVQEEIKKSRFICHVKRVYSEEEARDFITTIKKEHYKATHNCSAFIVGERSEIKRTSDDGEPSGTAGVPMLGVLENHNLTNVCVVVTRYFGGTLLGTGGLVRAYSQATTQALEQLSLCRRSQQYLWQLRAPVAEAGRIEAELRAGGANIVQTRWESQATIELASAVANPTELAALVANVTRGQGQLEAAGTKILELPL